MATIIKKRWFLLRWLRAALFCLVSEQQAINRTKEQAATWMPATPCDYCRVLVAASARFCPSCGIMRLPTTDPMSKHDVRAAMRQDSITSQMQAVKKPGERLMDTYRRIRKQNTGEEEAWIR